MIRTANLTGPVSRAAGGLYESVRRLVQELMTQEIDVSVIGTADEFTDHDLKAWDPISVTACRTWGPKRFGYSPEFWAAVKNYRPEILHTHGLWIYPSVVTLRYHLSTGQPYMISPHGMLDPWAVRNSYWRKRLASLLYEGAHLRRSACLRALCSEEAAAFRAYGLGNTVCIIPNGIDLPDENEKSSVRGKFPQTGVRTILFLGRIHPKKGLENALRAWKRVVPSDGAWRFVIAGWEEVGHEAYLKDLCDTLGLSWSSSHEDERASVIFHGPAYGEEKLRLLASSQAFLLSSFSEGLPMSILEAWAWELPVLMTRECNLPEGFNGGAAIRIGTDPDSIAEGIRSLLNMSQSCRETMGRAGYRLVKESFTWSHVASKMAQVYRWMLGGGAAPDCVERL
jgi:glycosyltransferase involved in cell wall biosynthesis